MSSFEHHVDDHIDDDDRAGDRNPTELPGDALESPGLRRRTSAMRRGVGGLAVPAGANVKAVRRMLGHASAAMTLDVYADLFDDDLDAVAAAVNHSAITQGVGKSWANGAS